MQYHEIPFSLENVKNVKWPWENEREISESIAAGREKGNNSIDFLLLPPVKQAINSFYSSSNPQADKWAWKVERVKKHRWKTNFRFSFFLLLLLLSIFVRFRFLTQFQREQSAWNISAELLKSNQVLIKSIEFIIFSSKVTQKKKKIVFPEHFCRAILCGPGPLS